MHLCQVNDTFLLVATNAKAATNATATGHAIWMECATAVLSTMLGNAGIAGSKLLELLFQLKAIRQHAKLDAILFSACTADSDTVLVQQNGSGPCATENSQHSFLFDDA